VKSDFDIVLRHIWIIASEFAFLFLFYRRFYQKKKF
jgi:hypothetical protein